MYIASAGIALGRSPAGTSHGELLHVDGIRLCEPGGEGPQRVGALLRTALQACLADGAPTQNVPLLLASSNGAAGRVEADDWRRAYDNTAWLQGTPWAGQVLPTVSGSCVSGLQALFLARLCLGHGSPEVVVAAVDVRSPANEENFRALRLLGQMRTPWQVPFCGFQLGEAAVAVRVTCRPGDGAVPLAGPLLSSLGGPRACVRGLGPSLTAARVQLVLGQATGPAQRDGEEVQALAESVAADVPVTSAIPAFGHTLGASGLLSLGLARALTQAPVPQFGFAGKASDGRPLFSGRALGADASCLVLSRALNDACGAVVYRAQQGAWPQPMPWKPPAPPSPVFTPWLRDL